MKVYLAGKITGDPNYREKFAAAAKKLEERAGVTVISPAVTPEGLKKVDYMRICFAMLESADTAVFLPDWEDSPGAQLEKHWCEYVGKKMVFLFLYVMLDLCWIGAECVFEGIVHESRVDGVVLAWLCLLLVREIEQFERKIGGDGR